MKFYRIVGVLRPGTLLTALLAVGGMAQDRQVEGSPVEAKGSSNGTANRPAADRAPGKGQAPSALSPGIESILKMADAGVSKEVLKAYVENSSIEYNPSAADMIALKEHKVPDDITTALLKKGGEVRAQNSQVNASSGTPVYSGLDPESYDYFQYYYLQPRSLASAYERLGVYSSPFDGYYSPFGPYGGPAYPYAGRTPVHRRAFHFSAAGNFQPSAAPGHHPFHGQNR